MKPFEWRTAFPSIFNDGGFDAVIGNPPYLNIDAVWGRNDPRLDYISSAYREIYSDKTDILFYFLKKSVDISKGEIGLIVSRSFLEAAKGRRLRSWLSSNASIRHVLDMRHAMVFPRVGINTAIVRLSHSRAVRTAEFSRYERRELPPGYAASTLRDPLLVSTVRVPSSRLSADSWLFGSVAVEEVVAKIDAAGDAIGEIVHIGEGMQTGLNKAFRFEASPKRLTELREQGLLFERARNSDIGNYQVADSGVHLLYLQDVRSFADLPSDVQAHMKVHEAALKERAAFRRGNCDWWRFTWPLHRDKVRLPRILCPYRAETNRFGLDLEASRLGLTDTTVLFESEQDESLLYLAGLLNTRILTARFRLIGKLLGGGVVEYYENTVRKLPIPRIGRDDPRHDLVVSQVAEIMQLQVNARTTLLADEQLEIGHQIAGLQESLERIAADLYGLSEEDVEVLDSLMVHPE